MELPHSLLNSIGFAFSDQEDLIRALGPLEDNEKNEIRRLWSANIPPVTSVDALSVMMGYNPGFVHSMTVSEKAHYRRFSIPKGSGKREIVAPKVAIKGVQKWLSFHFQKKFEPIDLVFGFVPGRSHVDAARKHLSATWVCSVDIENFFPSIRTSHLNDVFTFLGYETDESINLLVRLCSIKGILVQGAPTSPVLSNIALRKLDSDLQQYAKSTDVIVTRYADDIVMSGKGAPPANILGELIKIVTSYGWNIAERKTSLDIAPARLKVHGLLVHGQRVRLTKGYRNRVRAYKHLLDKNKIAAQDRNIVLGHIHYADFVERLSD